MSFLKDDLLSIKKDTNLIALNSSSTSACLIELLPLLDSHKQVLWVVPEKDQVMPQVKELLTISNKKALSFPTYEHYTFLPLIPSKEASSSRIHTLYELAEDRELTVVTEPRALVEKIIPKNELLNSLELLITDEEIERQDLLTWLIESGYDRVPKVKRSGEFSVRGEVIDIFSPNYALPLRVLFFDELIEEIRLFDPDDQRTVDKIGEAVLLPVRESLFFEEYIKRASRSIIERSKEFNWSASLVADVLQNLKHQRHTEASLSLLPFLYGELGSIFEYLQKDSIVIVQEPFLVAQKISEQFQKMEELYNAQLLRERLLHEKKAYFFDLSQLNDELLRKNRVFINYHSILNPPDLELSSLYEPPKKTFDIKSKKLDFSAICSKGKKGLEIFGQFFSKIDLWQEEGKKVVLLAQSQGSLNRLIGILEHYNRPYIEIKKEDLFNREFLKKDSSYIYILNGFLKDAFLSKKWATVFIPDHALFVVPKEVKKSSRKKGKIRPVSLSDVQKGDFIVHRDCGIGKYLGLIKMEINGVAGEFVLLEYHGGDKLYVPVDRLGLLQRYVGIEGKEPRLDRLGAKTWQTRKSKVKKKIQEIAHELVELYAIRKVTKGVRLEPPDEMYRQFEMRFPFEETKDQRKAIQEILEDLQAEYPMDRLLCGDVGFGKTEVAMRAAFLTVQNGYQVAVLVPTTLLAEQHERTFRERFRDFPVNISSISRLKSRSLQKQVLEKVKSGHIDILIGTHRLLQSDVFFKRLGLVIIDEEHRFGVKHKEKLKALTKEINSLSLTATPIPRTLQLSLLGIRDLSTLETPPKGRVAIKTFLAEYDDAIVKDALEREIKRGGQIFFIHNRIKGIYKVADHLKSLVKEARIDVAHGQMEPSELEEKMIRFVRGDIDCLVCTTIVESGLDIPAANTLIVNRADRLGIADLYQLRGRVGRSTAQAYAYLFVPNLDGLGKDASLRLKAIMETTDLGGGMNLAMHDLKIRGAGNLLGIAQAGQISEVGYDLYLDLLKDAIDAFKGKEVTERIEPEVNIGISSYIPEEYCPDIHERMELYRWFSEIETDSDKEEISDELRDRFGSVPDEVENLLNIMIIKSFLRYLNCVRLDAKVQNSLKLTFSFGKEGPYNPDKILKLIQTDGRFKLLPQDRLLMEIKNIDKEKFDLSKKIISLLNEIIKSIN